MKVVSLPLRTPGFAIERPRCGVSLLEVLVSMFVMLVGLVGVAALLPVGQHSLAEAVKADRVGACGRAGLREAKIRGILDPSNWVIYDTTTSNWNVRPTAMPLVAPTGVTYATPTGLNQGTAYVIDPLFIAYNGYPTATPAALPCIRFGYANYTGLPEIKRATLLRRPMNLLEPLGTPPTSAAGRLPQQQSDANLSKVLLYPEARRLFTFEDDLLFDVSTAPDIRTRANMLRLRADGSLVTLGGSAYPIIDTVDSNTEITGQVRVYQQSSEGNYTWMVTVSPALQEQSTVMSTSQLYTVSVVVFHKRILTMPASSDLKPCERVIRLAQSDLYQTRFGFGGGQLVLRTAYIPGIGSTSVRTDDYLETKPGDWLMVAATRVVPTQVGSETTNVDKGSVVCQWYRVINSVLGPSPSNSATIVRYVSVVGPDWRDLKDYAGSGENKPARYTSPIAVLVTGVVGVYQMTVNLDNGTAWSRATSN